MSEYIQLSSFIAKAESTAKSILNGLRGGKRASQIMAVQRHLYEAREAMHRDPPKASDQTALTDAQVKHMVDRFLGWKLPENFNPDGGISFKKTFNDHMPTPMKHEPSGTNVFDAQQATAMVRHMIEGMPKAG